MMPVKSALLNLPKYKYHNPFAGGGWVVCGLLYLELIFKPSFLYN